MSSHGKLNEHEQAKLKESRRQRKRIAIIAISSFVLVCIVVGAVVGAAVNRNGKKREGNGDSLSASVKAVCDVTLYKEKCFETVGSAPNASQLNPEELFNYAVKITLTELSKVLKEFSPNGQHMDNATSAAMGACVELLELAVDQLNEIMTSIINKTASSSFETVDDLRTWLSSVDTYQETCLDALVEANNPSLTNFGENHLKNSTEMTSNALAIITWLGKIADHVKLPHRRLMGVTGDLAMVEGRRLLENGGDLRKIATIVVAQDGSGNHKTISEALMDVKEKNETRTIIYVKEGIYFENVRVEKKIWNVVMVGDGQSKTIVSGRLNHNDGTSTFQTATFAVFGKGFMARDMGFRNTAGPTMGQAVALMTSADLVVFYKCTMDAFQDTLYAHAQRQFYRECAIYGTVDFIFGNAAVVFQFCDILPHRPMKGQAITITAQGKKDPNHNTGISIDQCSISTLDNLADVKTFLGRPWKDFSTTVIMNTFMEGFIDPKGWLPWVGDSAPDTIFYAEHLNYGPGASTKNRVTWRGLKTFLTKNEANRFTVIPFIDGNKWLPATKVPFT